MKIDLNEKSQLVSVEKVNADEFRLSTLINGNSNIVFSDAARQELILALFKVGNNELAELQEEIAPDYPNHANPTLFDYLWSIKCAYEGCSSANDDLHIILQTLTEGKTPEERYKIYLYAEQNANLIEENLKLQREMKELEDELQDLRARFC